MPQRRMKGRLHVRGEGTAPGRRFQNMAGMLGQGLEDLGGKRCAGRRGLCHCAGEAQRVRVAHCSVRTDISNSLYQR